MNRQFTAVVLALAAATLAAPARGQVYQKNILGIQGQVLDKSPQVGTGGYNAGVMLGTYGSFVRDTRLYVTGQVTGLAGFRGPLPYIASDQFQIPLPSAALSGFRSQSVGVSDVLAGQTLGPTPYFDPSKTVLKAPAIVGGLAATGTNVPAVPTVDASVRATLGRRLYVEALADYRALLPTSPGRALSVPPLGVPTGVFVPGGGGGAAPGALPAPGAKPQEEIVPGRGMLLDILGEKERALLGLEFFNLDKMNRPIGTSIDAQVYGEANSARPTEANFWRPPATLVHPGGEANATWALLGRVNADAFLELLQTLRQRREAGILAPPWNPPEANAPEAGIPTMAGGRIVELLAGGRIILHSLAGRGRDLVNRNLAEAERKLKAGKFYDSAEGFEVAAALGPGNPLPRLGRGLALLGAGEPLSAAQEIQAAMETFPVLMEISLDLPSIMGLIALKSRLAELDERLASPEEDREALLPFLACFLHQAQGDVAQAKAFAQQVKEAAPPSRVVQAYAEYVLTGKRPTSQPATAPATQPAAAPVAEAR